MKKLSFIILAVGFSLLGCSKNDSSGGGTVAATPNSGQYSYMNGSCYDNISHTIVAPNLCTNMVGTNGYASGPCYGQYIYVNPYGREIYGTCSGWNCSGYTLLEASTRRQVYCQ